MSDVRSTFDDRFRHGAKRAVSGRMPPSLLVPRKGNSDCRCVQGGASLAELLVSLVIGLVAVVAILQTFAAAEARKRNTTATAEAQQTGLVTLFTLASEIADAGAGLVSAAGELGTCPDTGDIRTTQ